MLSCSGGESVQPLGLFRSPQTHLCSFGKLNQKCLESIQDRCNFATFDQALGGELPNRLEHAVSRTMLRGTVIL